MSFGLQTFHSDGSLLLDISDRLTRIVAQYTITSSYPDSSGFQAVSGMSRDGSWMVVPGRDAYNTSFGGITCLVWDGGFKWGSLDGAFMYSSLMSFPVTVLRL
jgi:hypothetical protein